MYYNKIYFSYQEQKYFTYLERNFSVQELQNIKNLISQSKYIDNRIGEHLYKRGDDYSIFSTLGYRVYSIFAWSELQYLLDNSEIYSLKDKLFTKFRFKTTPKAYFKQIGSNFDFTVNENFVDSPEQSILISNQINKIKKLIAPYNQRLIDIVLPKIDNIINKIANTNVSEEIIKYNQYIGGETNIEEIKNNFEYGTLRYYKWLESFDKFKESLLDHAECYSYGNAAILTLSELLRNFLYDTDYVSGISYILTNTDNTKIELALNKLNVAYTMDTLNSLFTNYKTPLQSIFNICQNRYLDFYKFLDTISG